MPRQRSKPAEGIADDFHGEMSAPITRAFVPDVLVALIDYSQVGWLQNLQRVTDSFDASAVVDQGSTIRNGRTSTLA